MSGFDGTPEPKDRPNCLYKYRSFRRDCDRQRLLNLISASKIYYASPASFNDPFDCKVPPVESFDLSFVRYLIAARSAKTDEDHQEVYWKFDAPGSLTPAERDKLHLDLSPDEHVEFKAMIGDIQQKVNESGVVSFSVKNDGTLMWSHYADCHRGACLMFSSKEWPTMRPSLYPVRYRIKRLPLKLDRRSFDDGQFYQAVILTKDQDWCYEQEWRVLGKSCGSFLFPPEALVGIIFGYNMPDADKALLRRKVADKSHIALYQAMIKHDDFGLEILAC
jgi:hypothetical protein